MKKSNKKILYILFACIAVFIIAFSALMLNYANSPIDQKSSTVLVNIPVGTTLSEVVNILNQANLVKHPILFYGLIIMKGAARSIRAGEYEFNTSLTPSELIDKLSLDDMRYYLVTIPRSLSAQEIVKT